MKRSLLLGAVAGVLLLATPAVRAEDIPYAPWQAQVQTGTMPELVKNLRTLILMNHKDMKERGLAEFDLVVITSHARDGSTRAVYGYRVLTYDIPPGSVTGYMPELNILCGLDDYSRQSDQPLMKHQLVTISPSLGE